MEGSSEPDEHAEPEDAHMPNSFSLSSIASPSTYSKLMFVVFGSLFFISPFTVASGSIPKEPFRAYCANRRDTTSPCQVFWLRVRLLYPMRLSMQHSPCLLFFPFPDVLRLYRGWTCAFSHIKRTNTFGVCILWPESVSISNRQFLTSIGTFPTACTASVWNRIPRSFSISRISPQEYYPCLIVANMIETTAVSSSIAFKEHSCPVAPDCLQADKWPCDLFWQVLTEIRQQDVLRVLWLYVFFLAEIPQRSLLPVLSLSVPQLVKIISSGAAPIKRRPCPRVFYFLCNCPPMYACLTVAVKFCQIRASSQAFRRIWLWHYFRDISRSLISSNCNIIADQFSSVWLYPLLIVTWAITQPVHMPRKAIMTYSVYIYQFTSPLSSL